VAAVMELSNAVNRFEDDSAQGLAVQREAIEAMVLMLSPIVPHICHALWQRLGRQDPLIDQPWPRADATAMTQDRLEIVVQVNGKLRGRVGVAAGAAQPQVLELALADPNVQRFVADQPPRKVIYVPGKLLNIVV